MIDCRVHVNGRPFADSALELAAGAPTVLAGLDVTWGRETSVDQPEAATVRATVVDPSGGAGFRDVLPVGATLEVWAAGDISTGSPEDVAVDGGFELLAVGPAGNRVLASAGTPTVVAAPVAAGSRAIQLVGTAPATLTVPPDAFSSDPNTWDDVPRMEAGQTWTWRLAVHPAVSGTATVQGVTFTAPTSSAGTPTGPSLPVAGSGAYSTVSGDVTGAGPPAWLGVAVTFHAPVWTDEAGTWAAAAGTWADRGVAYVDELEVLAPAAGLVRDVLVFSGRITDETVTVYNTAGALRVNLTATDQLADLANRYVGDQPWPLESLSARVGRILNLAGVTTPAHIDPDLAGLQVTRRDVDNQPAGGLLAELAAGVDAVLWSATHATTGPYLWYEDMTDRATLAELALVGGVVVIVPTGGNRPEGRTVLSACLIPDAGATWIRDVTDVLTRVDASWWEQTTPELTEHVARVKDTAAEDDYGVRRAGVNTPLTTATDATAVANRMLARTRQPQWRTDGLVYDLSLAPPAAGDETAAALDLLDGTTRLGRGLVLTEVAHGPDPTVAAYLDGGQYRYDAAGWSLALNTIPWAGVADSGAWNTLDPTWTWQQFDPEICWADLVGVTGPLGVLEAA